jgi:tetratricopeptide (TPR) repeat protein
MTGCRGARRSSGAEERERMKSRERLVAGALLALGLNSVYLGARADASLVYFANVVLHVALGLACAVALGVLARRYWPQLSPMGRAAAATFGAGAAVGTALLVTGTTRPWRPLLWVHIALVGISALLALVAGFRRTLVSGPVGKVAMVAALLALASPFARLAADLDPPRQVIVNPALPPLTMEGEGQGPQGPFFPSSAETNVGHTIPSNFFMTAKECGRCHKEIYKQWSSSAHHFSSFNNQWYRKAVEYMQDVIGPRPSKWCAGCHDHAVLFNGQFDRPIRGRDETPEAQAGLTCTSCHSIVHVKSTMGQGDYMIEYPPLHDLAVSDNAVLRAGHDYLLHLDPGPHSRTFLKSFHREQTPEFCSVCHKVHLDVPVNDYRWFRGFDEYDNWQASGVSGQGARSFYYPPQPQQCADCHMPLVPADDPAARHGKVHSHRFPAANTALPFVNRDEEQLEVVQAFLRNAVTVDVFGLVPGEAGKFEERALPASGPTLSSTFATGEESMNFGATRAVLATPVEVTAPLDKVDATLRRGDSARVEVVVRTRKVGHFFPGGTVDAFDVWVEFEATDSNGRTLLHSGYVEDGGHGPVDPGAHFYRSLMLDEEGNPINKRNAWATRSVAYVRLIPPGAADTVHYRLRVPPDCGDRIFLKAKLDYRKFAWWNTQWAFAGVRDPVQKEFSIGPGHDDGRWVFTRDTSDVAGKVKKIPDIPITVLSEAEAQIRVLPRDAPEPRVQAFLDASVRERWNDYGIGLLLQGDLKGAEAAFLKVTKMDPGYADGWVNVGRARFREGNLPDAEKVLHQALEVDPNLASAHFFLAMALKGDGRYDAALAQLREAARRYPRDRVVQNQIGRILFLERQFKEAVAQLQKVLAIDPEDLQAHYNLMLAYQGAGDSVMARKHETLYRRFKANEAAQFITGPYRRLHPLDNNERQAIHEHGARGEESPGPRHYAARRSPDERRTSPAPTRRGVLPGGGAAPSAARAGGAR